MANNLRDFSKRMEQLAKDMAVNTDLLVKRVAVDVDAAIVIATPVDTGRARSNWQVSIDQAHTTEIRPYHPGIKRSTEGQNTRAAIEHAKQVISTRKQGQAIHITNNLHYIGRLNDGYSAQAESGFVQHAILIGIEAVRRSSILRRNRNSIDTNIE